MSGALPEAKRPTVSPHPTGSYEHLLRFYIKYRQDAKGNHRLSPVRK
jgi:hypothetical protein